MKTVNEVSKITGVNVRTLHYYDAIGLLKPTALTEAGYRLYDDTAIGRLQSILMKYTGCGIILLKTAITAQYRL